MKNFTDDFALHSLSKEVMRFMKMMEKRPHRFSKSKNVSLYLENLYKQGAITKLDYLFLSARIILNDFCYNVEERIGKGATTGFIFYCQERNLICYGAGANYPSYLQKHILRKPPARDMQGDTHYKDEVYIVRDVETCEIPEVKSVMKETGTKSLLSKRMRLNDFTLGTFEVNFPYVGGPTEEDIAYIKKEIQPLKEELYHIREEMIEALEHAIDNLGNCYMDQNDDKAISN